MASFLGDLAKDGLRRVPPAHRAAKAVNRRVWKRRLRRRAARLAPSTGLTIEVDPAAVSLALAPEIVHQLALEAPLRDRVASARGGDWDQHRPITDLPWIDAAEQRVGGGRSWPEIEFWRDVMEGVDRGERRSGAETREEAEAVFARFDRLIAAIRSDGYRDQRSLGTQRVWDEIMVAFDRHGRLLFVNGIHRLAAARSLRVPLVPAVVTLRHTDWVDFSNELRGYLAARGGRSYQPLTHPDLGDIPSQHAEDRLSMLLGHFPPAPARVLDIGCNWGYFSIELGKRGYSCLGVEYDEVHAYFARGLSAAADVDVEIVRGSVFELPLGGRFDVALALSIFHHFLKQQETIDQLAALLRRLDVGIMVFQPHLPASDAMRDAAWNPEPDEFTAWVASMAGLSVAETLGVARDGRPLYLLASTPDLVAP